MKERIQGLEEKNIQIMNWIDKMPPGKEPGEMGAGDKDQEGMKDLVDKINELEDKNTANLDQIV